MLAHIYGLALELDILGLEALPHHVGGLEMHFPRQLTQTVHNAVTGDIDTVAMRYGVECPPHETRPATGSNRRGDVSIGSDLPPWDCTDDVVDALVDVRSHPAK